MRNSSGMKVTKASPAGIVKKNRGNRTPRSDLQIITLQYGSEMRNINGVIAMTKSVITKYHLSGAEILAIDNIHRKLMMLATRSYHARKLSKDITSRWP